MIIEKLRNYLDSTFAQFHFEEPPHCDQCKKRIQFGVVCWIRRMYEKVFNVYCLTCGADQKNEVIKIKVRDASVLAA